MSSTHRKKAPSPKNSAHTEKTNLRECLSAVVGGASITLAVAPGATARLIRWQSCRSRQPSSERRR